MSIFSSGSEALDLLLDGWTPTGRPKRLQLAVDGWWEDARIVEMPADAGAARELVRAAGPDDADVAVELEWLGSPLAFVGARRAGERDGASFKDAVAGIAEQDPSDPRRALAQLAGGPPAGLVHVELGAANAWRSVGPMRLWAPGETSAPASIAGRLRERPDLALCRAPVALAVAYDRPRSCWFGVEVSTPSGQEHAVAPATVDALLDRLFAVDV